MNKKEVFEIIDRIERSSLTKFEYSNKGTKILIEKNSSNAGLKSPVSVKTYENEIMQETVTESVKGNALKSPIVGTFYSRPTPESERFVSVGDKVKKGDVVCIIEAMKLFNEIVADNDGTVTKILVSDGEMVAFDQPIMIIE